MDFDQPHPAAFDIEVGVLPKSGQQVSFTADNKLRTDLAEHYTLISVDTYQFKGKVTRWQKDGAKFQGSFNAQVLAPCVVTGEPVPQEVEQELELFFAPEHSKIFKPQKQEDTEAQIVMAIEESDPPEPFTGNSADLGSLIAEYFSLALNPFPRSEGAELSSDFSSVDSDAAMGETDEEKPSPFAVLENLKGPSE